MVELVENFGGLEFKYIFKESKYDCKYMIVVFSGFAATGNFTYDFRNALKDAFAAVLWIKDDFFGNCCYYYSYKNENIDHSINQFILKKAEEKGFLKENIIVSGFSKGGTAAIYYGVKYNYSYIISTVPQLKVATYNLQSHRDILLHMLGENYSEVDFLKLDNAIIDHVIKDDKVDKNIYLLTSKADKQYKDQLEPYLHYFNKYKNIAKQITFFR